MGIASGLFRAAVVPLAFAGPALAADTGLQRHVVFDQASPLADNAELARRALSPMALAEAQAKLARTLEGIGGQAIDLKQEQFVLYVPPKAPPGGYGLLVFIPPWDDQEVPRGWTEGLDRLGVIYVAAAGSGNEASVLGRRQPLAILAAANVMARYPVDPQKVFVGGFSGGSRAALRLALAYPDLFAGALLNSGSDPIGTAGEALPPRDLFARFQAHSRLAFVTGEQDGVNVDMDLAARRALADWCVFAVQSHVVPRVGHQPMPPGEFAWALDALIRPRAPDAARLAACRGRVDRELKAKLEQAEALKAQGRADEAQKALKAIDVRFGGLATP